MKECTAKIRFEEVKALGLEGAGGWTEQARVEE